MESFESLRKKQVQFVRCIWTDASGIRRLRVVPLKKFFESVTRDGLAICQAIQFFPMHGDMVVESAGLSASGEFHLLPEVKTLRQVPHYPHHAVALGSIPDGKDFCPRSILQGAVNQAKKEFGLDVLCGFEFEFVLLKSFPAEYKAFDEHVYSEARAMYKAASILDAICTSLAQQDIEVLMYHPEACYGQYELTTAPGDPLKTADNCILTKETIYEVAGQNDLRATFCPKPFDHQPGTGMHCHVSIWKDGVNLITNPDGKYHVGEAGGHFMAGVLHNLPAIMAFTLPAKGSYRRLLPGYWSGAYQMWGQEDREAPIRLCSPAGCAPNEYTNFEVKSVDGTCNPYLAIAAIIFGGLDGMRHKRQLPAPANSSQVDPAKSSLPLLPTSLDQAVAELERNEAMKLGFGDYANRFASVRKFELGALADLTFEEERLMLSSRF